MSKEKIAFVIHRFGDEIIGGAENLCKNYLSLLLDKYDIDILTTTAINHLTWDNYYKPGIYIKKNYRILRFKVTSPKKNKFLKLFNYMLFNKKFTILDEIEFSKLQGPYSENLLYYIKEHQDSYKYFFFFTYLYFTTYFGSQIVPDKSILIPTAHNEPMFYFSMYKNIFRSPKGIIFLSNAEKKLVHNIMKNNYVKNIVAGLPITPKIYKKDIAITIPEKPYILYAGRIEPAKNCDKLISYFIHFINETSLNLNLFFIGKKDMNIINHKNIYFLGTLSENDKNYIIKNAYTMIQPSQFESFSISTLEAMYYGVPVLVNKLAGPLQEHIEFSKGGFAYTTYDEFKIYLMILLKNKKLYKLLSSNAKNYVLNRYNKKTVREKILNFLKTDK